MERIRATRDRVGPRRANQRPRVLPGEPGPTRLIRALWDGSGPVGRTRILEGESGPAG